VAIRENAVAVYERNKEKRSEIFDDVFKVKQKDEQKFVELKDYFFDHMDQ